MSILIPKRRIGTSKTQKLKKSGANIRKKENAATERDKNMRQFLIDKLSELTDEEKALISGEKLNRRLYTRNDTFGSSFEVDETQLSDRGEMITIRPNTRFVDFDMHGHTYTEFLYVIKGTVRTSHSEGEIELKQGDLLMLNRHIRHSLSKTTDKDLAVNFIISNEFVESMLRKFDGESTVLTFLSESVRSAGKPSCLVFSSEGNIPVENLLESITYSLCERKYTPRSGEYSVNVAIDDPQKAENEILASELALALRILESTPKALVYEFHAAEAHSDIYEKVMDYIKNEYRTANLSELASRLYLSTGYLSRWISLNAGATFRDLLMDQRFSVAEYLILNTDLPIGTIASSVGYDNRSFFHREFIRRYKVSPLRMRKTRYENSGN